MASRYSMAVGIEYKLGQGGTPVRGACGYHESADQLVQIARRWGIPVIERPALARGLAEVEQGREIPRDLFELVAAVLAPLEEL